MLSRNPPYGKKLLEQLEGFPRLTVNATILMAQLTPKNSDRDTAVTLKAHLGYTNSKGVPCWRSTIPVVTFIAETDDGRLCHFWRSNIKNAHGIDIKFPVPLKRTEGLVKCFFSCEDIVGTQVMATCRTPPSGVAADSTEKPRKNPMEKSSVVSTRYPQAEPGLTSDPIFDDLDDEDMLGVIDAHKTPNVPENEEYPDIMEFLNLPSSEPARMENGRWLCNHTCRGGGLTKGGRPCSHKCCHEGLGKPRPPPQRKDKEKGKKADKIEGAKKPSKDDKKETKRKHADEKNERPRCQPTAKKQRHSPSLDEDLDEDLDDLDLIDLSMSIGGNKPEAARTQSQESRPSQDPIYFELDEDPIALDEGPTTVSEVSIEPVEPPLEFESEEGDENRVWGQGAEDSGNWSPLLGPDPFAVAMDVQRAPSPPQEIPAWLAEMGTEMFDLVHGVVEMEEDGYRP